MWVSAYFITLKEAHWRRVFKNRLLRKAFVSEGEEIVGDCRKTHDEGLQDLYLSPNNLRVTRWKRMWWAGHVACMGKKINSSEILVVIPEGKRLLERPSCTWEVNIKAHLQEIDVRTWIGLIWLGTGTNGVLFCTQWWSVGCHKMYRISSLAEELLASQERPCFMELVVR